MQRNGSSCIRLPTDVDGVDFDFKSQELDYILSVANII